MEIKLTLIIAFVMCFAMASCTYTFNNEQSRRIIEITSRLEYCKELKGNWVAERGDYKCELK